MSYARCGERSDVYVVRTGLKPAIWNCYSCIASDDETRTFSTLDQLRRHMGWHVYSGHRVPAKVFERIEREINDSNLPTNLHIC